MPSTNLFLKLFEGILHHMWFVNINKWLISMSAKTLIVYFRSGCFYSHRSANFQNPKHLCLLAQVADFYIYDTGMWPSLCLQMSKLGNQLAQCWLQSYIYIFKASLTNDTYVFIVPTTPLSRRWDLTRPDVSVRGLASFHKIFDKKPRPCVCKI